jgi:hypothetical protein
MVYIRIACTVPCGTYKEVGLNRDRQVKKQLRYLRQASNCTKMVSVWDPERYGIKVQCHALEKKQIQKYISTYNSSKMRLNFTCIFQFWYLGMYLSKKGQPLTRITSKYRKYKELFQFMILKY